MMEAIPHRRISANEFNHIRWPQMTDQVENKRSRYLERYKKAESK
jgi:hypothetical protein